MNHLQALWEKSFTQWPYRIALHLGFWLFYLFFWLNESMVVKIAPGQHYRVLFTGIVFVAFLYYGLAYWIWPLLKKRKWIRAGLSLILFYAAAISIRTYYIQILINWYNLQSVTVAGGEFWQQLYQSQFKPIPAFRTLLSGFTSLVGIVYVPLSLKFMRYVYRANQQRMWMLRENTRLQVNTLKAQINPHFFFNTLNNLQSFIVQNEKSRSVELLNRLADFMRASLYDGEREYITMEKEISLLGNYINIERVRFEDDARIDSLLEQTHPDYKIPPFIFLPFVENAFKHGGTLPAKDVCIRILLRHTDQKITLTTTNVYLPGGSSAAGGIGLQNIRKRLDHYFPGSYELTTSTAGNIFTANLVISK